MVESAKLKMQRITRTKVKEIVQAFRCLPYKWVIHLTLALPGVGFPLQIEVQIS